MRINMYESGIESRQRKAPVKGLLGAKRSNNARFVLLWYGAQEGTRFHWRIQQKRDF
jgi:hypothetical protein